MNNNFCDFFRAPMELDDLFSHLYYKYYKQIAPMEHQHRGCDLFVINNGNQITSSVGADLYILCGILKVNSMRLA